MWQSLQDELGEQSFSVVAVALDQAEAARPWIESAHPTYPCLIDQDHRLAEQYQLVNVPQAVWIDEAGRMVRPPHTAGATDGFRAMDRQTFTMPEAVVQERLRTRQLYSRAVRDWVRHGAASANALQEAQALARLPDTRDEVALAHAHFRLGLLLRRLGENAEAEANLAEATRLHPDSWAMWRQAAPKDARGLASGEAFWRRVDDLGTRPYYAPVDLVAPPDDGPSAAPG